MRSSASSYASATLSIVATSASSRARRAGVNVLSTNSLHGRCPVIVIIPGVSAVRVGESPVAMGAAEGCRQAPCRFESPATCIESSCHTASRSHRVRADAHLAWPKAEREAPPRGGRQPKMQGGQQMHSPAGGNSDPRGASSGWVESVRYGVQDAGRVRTRSAPPSAARGETPRLHRERRGAPPDGRREEGAYWAYATDEQRSQAGCIAARMQRGLSPRAVRSETGRGASRGRGSPRRRGTRGRRRRDRSATRPSHPRRGAPGRQSRGREGCA